MWTDIVLRHEGPSETIDTKIAALRLKFNAFKELEGEKVAQTYTWLKILLNDLLNKGDNIHQAEVNANFVYSLPGKWLKLNETHKANNSIQNDSLATLFGKYNYEEEIIDQIYEPKNKKVHIHTFMTTALFSSSNVHVPDSNSDVEEDTRSSREFMVDLTIQFQDIALLSNQRRFYKRLGRCCSAKGTTDKSKETCFKYGIT